MEHKKDRNEGGAMIEGVAEWAAQLDVASFDDLPIEPLEPEKIRFASIRRPSWSTYLWVPSEKVWVPYPATSSESGNCLYCPDLSTKLALAEKVIEAAEAYQEHLPNMELTGAARFSSQLTMAMSLRRAIKEYRGEVCTQCVGFDEQHTHQHFVNTKQALETKLAEADKIIEYTSRLLSSIRRDDSDEYEDLLNLLNVKIKDYQGENYDGYAAIRT